MSRKNPHFELFDHQFSRPVKLSVGSYVDTIYSINRVLNR